MKKLTHTQFIEKAREVHGDVYDYFKTVYKTMRKKIVITCNEHGDFEMLPGSHLNQKQGCRECKRYSRLDGRRLTTNKFVEAANKVHNNKYTYLKTIYTKSTDKVIITCKEHGDFEQNSSSHLQGSGCKKCYKPKGRYKKRSTKEFITKAKKIHGKRYNYSILTYTNSYTKVKIICQEHGEFEQLANNHLRGQGCIECALECTGWTYSNWEKASEKSNNFDSFKVYIIKCWNENEEFYKIGKTYTTINKRFRRFKDKKLPYSYEVVKIFEGGAREMSELEKQLQKENKSNKYTPKIKFGGMYECFKIIK